MVILHGKKILKHFVINPELAFIIAHEMGHNFGMHHDGNEWGSECTKPVKKRLKYFFTFNP